MKLLNDNCMKLAAITEKQYEQWCKETKQNKKWTSVKRKFFHLILTDRLCWDDDSQTFVKKYKSKAADYARMFKRS